VIDISSQKWARLAAVGALVAALGLSACGRKGPLDPPPSAAAPVQYSGEPGAPQRAAPSQIVGADGKAAAPPPSGSQQRFILDWLVE
jgi:predicted small lipoprotein YifL